MFPSLFFLINKGERKLKTRLILSWAAIVSLSIMVGCGLKQNAADIHFTVEQNSFELQPWKSDDSHNKQIKGTLTLGNKGIENADILYDGKKVIHTDKDGSFSFIVDQTALAHKELVVQSVDHAVVDGKTMNKDVLENLKKQVVNLDVYYPIKIVKTKEKGDKIDVQAQLKAAGDNQYPTVKVDKYTAEGIVKDANGKPVSGAVVSMIENDPEGWVKSKPANEKGEYSLVFMSSAEERMLRVSVGEKQYLLPENKRLTIPGDASVEINITLPKNGLVINDVPPYLVNKTINGAIYAGVMPGINAAKGSFEITVPNLDGTFSFTIDKKVWESNPTFYENYINTFSKSEVESGKPLPKDLNRDPMPNEPKTIKVSS
jgi:hypothetical protein